MRASSAPSTEKKAFVAPLSGLGRQPPAAALSRASAWAIGASRLSCG